MKTKSPKVTSTTKKTKITTHGSTSGNLTTKEIEKLNKRDYKIWLQGYDTGAKNQAKVFEKRLSQEIEYKSTYTPDIDVPNIKEWNNPEPSNYWKWVCLAIFLGVIGGMILSTPHIISALDACK